MESVPYLMRQHVGSMAPVFPRRTVPGSDPGARPHSPTLQGRLRRVRIDLNTRAPSSEPSSPRIADFWILHPLTYHGAKKWIQLWQRQVQGKQNAVLDVEANTVENVNARVQCLTWIFLSIARSMQLFQRATKIRTQLTSESWVGGTG